MDNNPPILEPQDPYKRNLWVMWCVLNFLIDKAWEGTIYVPSHELREYTRTLTKTDDQRDDAIATLRQSGAIVRGNDAGRANRNYYITRVGQDLASVYDKELRQ